MERKQIRINGKSWAKLDSGLYYEPLIEVCAKTAYYNNADDVWSVFEELVGGERTEDWMDEFNLFPNVDAALNIIKNEDNFILFGNWILTDSISSEAFEKLDDLDLVPYYGYDYEYSYFLTI